MSHVLCMYSNLLFIYFYIEIIESMAGLLCVVFQNQFFIQLHLFKEQCGTYNFIRTRNCNNSRYVHITYDGETVLRVTSLLEHTVKGTFYSEDVGEIVIMPFI